MVFMGIIKINGSRLYLKELTIKDISEKYILWLNDPEVNQFLESRFSKHTLENVQKFVEGARQSESTILLGIFVKDKMKHIGNIKIDQINIYHQHMSVGLMIGDKSEWGNGYATESIRMITKFAFEKLNISKISAGCYESNIGSKAAFEKSGYQVEGLLRSHVKLINCREGVWKMGYLASDFNASKYK